MLIKFKKKEKPPVTHCYGNFVLLLLLAVYCVHAKDNYVRQEMRSIDQNNGLLFSTSSYANELQKLHSTVADDTTRVNNLPKLRKHKPT